MITKKGIINSIQKEFEINGFKLKKHIQSNKAILYQDSLLQKWKSLDNWKQRIITIYDSNKNNLQSFYDYRRNLPTLSEERRLIKTLNIIAYRLFYNLYLKDHYRDATRYLFSPEERFLSRNEYNQNCPGTKNLYKLRYPSHKNVKE